MTKYEFEKEVIFIRNQYMDYQSNIEIITARPNNEYDIINMIYEALVDLIKENKEIVKSLSANFSQSLRLLLFSIKNEIKKEQTSVSLVHRAAIAERLAEDVYDVIKA